MVQCKRFAVGVMLLMTCLLAVADSSIVVRDAWVREAPPGAAVLAAYLTLENPGSKADKLVAVRCPDFDKIEIHATEIRSGVAHMIALDALPIPPQAVVKLAPGGYHLMLHHPRRALAAGMSIKLELRFDSGARVTVVAPVRRAQSGAAHHH
ncbi:MAG TPA: copper chaperone PCu(A)C [Acidiferrobacterales bacterium]|nr:copper chaperone PCu(A)C [Acidiferrobacterales bacterium]